MVKVKVLFACNVKIVELQVTIKKQKMGTALHILFNIFNQSIL